MKKRLFALREREICVLLALAACLLLTILPGCRSHRETTTTEQKQETHSYTTVTHRRTAPDTIIYMLAPQYEERVVHDTVSVLRNDYAESRVKLQSDGTFTHTLDSRDRSVKVPVQAVEERTDTLRLTSSQRTAIDATPKARKPSAIYLLAAGAAALLFGFGGWCIGKYRQNS